MWTSWATIRQEPEDMEVKGDIEPELIEGLVSYRMEQEVIAQQRAETLHGKWGALRSRARQVLDRLDYGSVDELVPDKELASEEEEEEEEQAIYKDCDKEDDEDVK
jgi:hypothetical protein